MPTDPETRRLIPQHMQRLLQEHARNIDDEQAPSESRRRALDRRRMAIQFDIDQGELALAPENPWTHRIELLSEALANVESDLRAAQQIQSVTLAALSATPIQNVSVSAQEPYLVTFQIGDEEFSWNERLDWVERGGLLAQPEFLQERGDVAAIIPEEFPHELRDAIGAHLQNSVMSYAVALRDARLNDETLPDTATLADMARLCPVCGGWMEYNGACNTCAQRKASVQSLFLERQRLMQERSAEAEERHRLGERLPLARKRMADLERELAELDT